MATKAKKDDFAAEWMGRIKSGVDYRKKYSTRSRWDEFRKMYRNQWGAGILPVNKIFSYGRMLVPRVYFRAPRVSVTATRPDMVWHARVVEEIDNMLLRRAMLKKTIKMSILDSYLCGVGPIKLGYDSEFGYLPDQAINEDGETATQLSRRTGDRIEYHANVEPGMPWALRCRPEDIIVPWGSDDPDSLPWIGHYILRPLDDVKADQKYDQSVTKELKGTRTPAMEDSKSAKFRPREEKDKDVQFAELWEVRDVHTRKLMVFCENQLILAEDDVLQFDGLPYEFIMFNPDPEYFWAIPDADIMDPLQKELNDEETQISQHRAITLLKFLYKTGTISEAELSKMLSGVVGPAIAINGDEPIGNLITTLQPHIPPDLGMAKKGTLQDIQEALGYSVNQTGSFSPYHGKTAAESEIVDEAFENRTDERKDIVVDTLLGVVRKWNQMIFRFWTQTKVARIVTPQGEPYWVNYTGEELRGSYSLEMDIDSGMPFTRTMKHQVYSKALEEYNGDPMIDQVLLRQMHLDSMAPVDPRFRLLLSKPEGIDPQVTSALRQPSPRGPKGSSRRSGPSSRGAAQDKPISLGELSGGGA